MFFISPIKALYSIKFYLQTLKEPLWKAFCFVIYLFVLGAIFITIYIPAKTKPIIGNFIEEVAELTPDISINKGVITANDNKKLIITHPKLEGYKIIFDTASTEPAYPTQMAKENILAYVNKNRVYISYNGQFQEHAMPADKDYTITKQELLKSKQDIAQIGSYFVLSIALLALFFQMFFYILLALLIVSIINLSTKANLGFKRLFTLALYLQAPVSVIALLLLFSPLQIVGLSSLVIIIAIVIYANLIFGALRNMWLGKEVNN